MSPGRDDLPGPAPEQELEVEDTTSIRIRLRELRARQREHRRDLESHETEIKALREQAARIDERVKFLTRTYWVGMGILAALVTSGFAAVLSMLRKP